MELFQQRGYEHTTVADIAAKAGLTERTFFRYFSDKREVLFSGAKALEKLIVDAIASAPVALPPFEVVFAALKTTAPLFESRRAHARQRQALLSQHAELRERELGKLANIAVRISESLQARHVSAANATLIAEAAVAIYRSAFERWVADTKHDLPHHLQAALAQLRKLTASAKTATPATKAARTRH